jgi:hypothetical protein
MIDAHMRYPRRLNLIGEAYGGDGFNVDGVVSLER